jgi:RHS repeat-associated protein
MKKRMIRQGNFESYHFTIYQINGMYDACGFPQRIKTIENNNPLPIENYRHTFDKKHGNLTNRSTYKYYKFEDFTYDNLERLETETISGNALATSYAGNGNILTRTDIGDYAYSGQDAGPHAVTGITDASGTLLQQRKQTVSYTAFNKVSHIAQGGLDYFITYGSDRLRLSTSLHNDMQDALMTKQYAFGDYERETSPAGTRHLHYIQGGDGLAAVYVKTDGGSDSLYFILKDHLGSITGAINSESGKVYHQSFDAWGRKRNPENWSYTDIPDFPFDRGFTGHEHLDRFGLINMNGRMYDAALCRFLSPDPFVQMPDYSQNFNRYSYALNNPLVFTDPSGEFLIAFGIGFIVGAYIGGSLAEGGELNPTKWAWDYNTVMNGVLPGGILGGIAGGGGWGLATGAFKLSVGAGVAGIGEVGIAYDQISGTDFQWTTSAGGGGSISMNTNGNQNYAQVVDQEIYGVQEEYRNTWFGIDDTKGKEYLSYIWNSDLMRLQTGDALYFDASGVLDFVGGGGYEAGIIMPLRGKEAFSVYAFDTYKGKIGLHGGVGINFGKAWYTGSVHNMEFASSYPGLSQSVELDYYLGTEFTIGSMDIHGNRWLSLDVGVGPAVGGSIVPGAKTNIRKLKFWYGK